MSRDSGLAGFSQTLPSLVVLAGVTHSAAFRCHRGCAGRSRKPSCTCLGPWCFSVWPLLLMGVLPAWPKFSSGRCLPRGRNRATLRKPTLGSPTTSPLQHRVVWSRPKASPDVIDLCMGGEHVQKRARRSPCRGRCAPSLPTARYVCSCWRDRTAAVSKQTSQPMRVPMPGVRIFHL